MYCKIVTDQCFIVLFFLKKISNPENGKFVKLKLNTEISSEKNKPYTIFHVFNRKGGRNVMNPFADKDLEVNRDMC